MITTALVILAAFLAGFLLGLCAFGWALASAVRTQRPFACHGGVYRVVPEETYLLMRQAYWEQSAQREHGRRFHPAQILRPDHLAEAAFPQHDDHRQGSFDDLATAAREVAVESAAALDEEATAVSDRIVEVDGVHKRGSVGSGG